MRITRAKTCDFHLCINLRIFFIIFELEFWSRVVNTCKEYMKKVNNTADM